jgi:hypothetical protein
MAVLLWHYSRNWWLGRLYIIIIHCLIWRKLCCLSCLVTIFRQIKYLSYTHCLIGSRCLLQVLCVDSLLTLVEMCPVQSSPVATVLILYFTPQFLRALNSDRCLSCLNGKFRLINSEKGPLHFLLQYEKLQAE